MRNTDYVLIVSNQIIILSIMENGVNFVIPRDFPRTLTNELVVIKKLMTLSKNRNWNQFPPIFHWNEYLMNGLPILNIWRKAALEQYLKLNGSMGQLEGEILKIKNETGEKN